MPAPPTGAGRGTRQVQVQWSGQDMRELVEHIARALVDDSESVKVSEVEGENVTVIELRVAQGDLGKVIGKQGRTARAIRTILNANATKLRKRAVLEIIE
jgi:predicted RNA-binding protein YlqC (UPF0109 family)